MKHQKYFSAITIIVRIAVILGLIVVPSSGWGQEAAEQPKDETAQQLEQSTPQVILDSPVQYKKDSRNVHIGIIRLDDPRVRIEAREARSTSGAVGGYQVAWQQAQMANAVMAINADYSAGKGADDLLSNSTCKIKNWNPSGSSHACSEGLFYVNGDNRSNWTENSTGYRSVIAFDQNNRAWIGLGKDVPLWFPVNFCA